MTEPIFKWTGSKRRLLGELTSRLPVDHSTRIHVEPFVGSGALFFATEPERARLSDVNQALIKVYDRVRTDGDEVFSDADRLLQSVDWQNIRDVAPYNPTAFLAVLYGGYNGLWRVNRMGKCNVPRGLAKQIKQRDMSAHQALLSRPGIEIECMHWQPALAKPHVSNAFVYLDPPYYKTFAEYDARGISHRQLAHVATAIDAPVMISYDDCDEVRNLYSDPKWRIEAVEIKYSGASKKTTELIIRNY